MHVNKTGKDSFNVEAKNKYERKNNLVKKTLGMRKRKYITDEIKEIEENLKNWEIRNLYQSDENEIVSISKKYLEELLNNRNRIG